MLEKNIPLSELPEDLNQTWQYWRVRGGELLNCSWQKTNLEELPAPIVPFTMVIDCFRNIDDNVFRFWGSGMTYIHGKDMTGASPYEIFPSDLALALRETHLKMYDEPVASASVFGFQHTAGFNHIHTSLRLPLSNDGKRLDHILVSTRLTDDGAEYWENQHRSDNSI